MKTITFINLLAALLLCSIPAMARLSQDEDAVATAITYPTTITDAELEAGQEDMAETAKTWSRGIVDLGDSEAFDYGYKEAEMLFYDDYTCNNVFPEFWLDVKGQVFDRCDSRWAGFWQDKVDECEEGAKDFVLTQLGDCATTEDCYQRGIGAAASVADRFCGHHYTDDREREWLPRECEKHATTSCQCDVVNLVQEFIDGNVCDAAYRDDGAGALYSIDELYRLCVEEIEEMLNEVNLD